MIPTTHEIFGQLTLGSLFDGSGGFPLAGIRLGIKPLWASEIEPFPILVSRKHFPDMTHLGDVRKIHGAEIKPVDILTFGSPCTDLSVAGKRQGFEGKDSALFFEAIRIVKEMRKATNNQYPKYLLWENVPGAFSSQKGGDFHEVLKALILLSDETLPVPPRPPKWPRAGAIVADRCSLAWRVLDAQFFGVPQRRKRIYLVADLRGSRAPEILFEPKSLSEHFNEGCEVSKDIATDARGDLKTSDCITFLEDQGDAFLRPLQETAPTLRVEVKSHVPLVFNVNSAFSGSKALAKSSTVSKTLDCQINANCNQGATLIAYGIDHSGCQSTERPVFGATIGENLHPTILARGPGAVCYCHLVRKLTPLECCRLQGFPDDWCKDLEILNPTEEELVYWQGVWSHWNKLRGVKSPSQTRILSWLKNPYSDVAQYKLWGNGIALFCAEFVLHRLVNMHGKGPESLGIS